MSLLGNSKSQINFTVFTEEVAKFRKIKFESIEIKSLLEVSRILTSNRTLNRKLSNT